MLDKLPMFDDLLKKNGKKTSKCNITLIVFELIFSLFLFITDADTPSDGSDASKLINE